MKSRFKSNNLFAVLIALFLIAAGFVLGFIHRQSESSEKQDKTPVAVVIGTDSQKDIFSI
jgi:hypothetical protein